MRGGVIMPLPVFIVGASIAGASALFGAGKTIKAGIDSKDAKDTNELAESIINEATDLINERRKVSGDILENYGQRKVDVLNGNIAKYLSTMQKIKNLKLGESIGVDELKNEEYKKNISELKLLQTTAASLAGGVASGAVTGALTAFGAYGLASTFGVATTGTAISSLSGVVATNATLAFLGGGALGTGLGIAGGTAILGGLVAGPALAVMGLVTGAVASKNKDKAYQNYAEAKKYREEMKLAATMCDSISRRTRMFDRFLVSLNSSFEPLVYELNDLVENKGCDYNSYNDQEKELVAKSFSVAKAVKSIIDKPILTEDGNLVDMKIGEINDIREMVSAY